MKAKYRSLIGVILIAVLVLFNVIVVPPGRVLAATISVNTTNDETTTNGQCSLREAIGNANDTLAPPDFPDCNTPSYGGADTITFTSASTITLTVGSPISIISPVTIQGPTTLSGNNATNIFVIGAGSLPTIILNDVNFQNGKTLGSGGAILANNPAVLQIIKATFSNNNADGDGGAIHMTGSTSSLDFGDNANPTVEATIFQNNSAKGNGGAIYKGGASLANPSNIRDAAFKNNVAGTDSANTDGNGGAIYNNGPLSLFGTYFQGNSASNADSADGGGAIFNDSSGTLNIAGNAFSGNTTGGSEAWGGAIYNRGILSVEYSHFGTTPLPFPAPFNTLTGGNQTTGADARGGAIYTAGTTLILGCTFLGNTSTVAGGAVYNDNPGDDTTIANSTISNNSAQGTGGAIYHRNTDDLMQIINVTIADNTAPSAGGIFNNGDGDSPGASVFDDIEISNTILANNSGGNCVGGSLTSRGGNVASGTVCDLRDAVTGAADTTVVTVDPSLQTAQIAFTFPEIVVYVRPIPTGSSAQDVGINSICAAFPILNIDQRKIFTRPAGPICDSGAYEQGVPLPTATPTPTNTPVPPTATATATATDTVIPTDTATATATATIIPTDTATATGSASVFPTPTSTATATATIIPTDTATATSSATVISTSTATATASLTAIFTSTATATIIPTDTATATSTATVIPTNTATSTGSVTAIFTSTATTTIIPTDTATATSSATVIPTNTATSTGSVTAIPTSTATSSATVIPTNTATSTGSVTTIPTSTATLSATLTATATGTLPTATATSTAPTPTPATPAIVVVDPALTKLGSLSLALPGEVVTFTLTATNKGTAPAQNVVIDDQLPPEYFTPISATTTKGTFTIIGNNVKFFVGTLNPGEVVNFTIVTRVRADAPTPSDAINVATLTHSTGSSRIATFTVRISRGSLPNTGERPENSFPVAQMAVVGGLLLIMIGAVAMRKRRSLR